MAALGNCGGAGRGAGAGPGVSAAAAARFRQRHRGHRRRWHAAARLRRRRWRVALSGRSGQRVAAVPAGPAELRGPLVLPASGRQPAGPAARGRAVAAQRRHRFRRLDPEHAGCTHPRWRRHPQHRRQAAPDRPRPAAGSAAVQGADPAAVPGAGAVRRHHRGCGSGQLGLPGQTGLQPVPCRGRAAGGAAAGTQPLASGPPSGRFTRGA